MSYKPAIGSYIYIFLFLDTRVYIVVCINLMIRVSHIQGHEIHIVLYARLDSGDLLLYQSRLRGLYTNAPPP